MALKRLMVTHTKTALILGVSAINADMLHVMGVADMTLYNSQGLRADLDESAVSLYLEGVHVVTMTLDEWNAVNAAIMEVKSDE